MPFGCMKTLKLFRDAKIRLPNRFRPRNLNLPAAEGELRDAIQQTGVPGQEGRQVLYFPAGGGVTTAVIFRIMPSDLLKT